MKAHDGECVRDVLIGEVRISKRTCTCLCVWWAVTSETFRDYRDLLRQDDMI